MTHPSPLKRDLFIAPVQLPKVVVNKFVLDGSRGGGQKEMSVKMQTKPQSRLITYMTFEGDPSRASGHYRNDTREPYLFIRRSKKNIMTGAR